MFLLNTHATAVRATWFSILSNTALAVIKWLAGIFGNSYALIADAIESTSDILASFLVLVGLKYTNRPADANHPYGHGRAEPLFTFVVVAFLVTSAAVIAYKSIQHILVPDGPPRPFTLIILAAIIIWKELSFQYVLKKSKQTKSTSLKADAWHHRSDAITSVAAFIGIALSIFMGKGFESADDWAALLASGFILYNSYLIFRPALSEIMDEHLYDDLIAEIRVIAQDVDGILGTEKCFIRKSGMKYHVDLHAIMDGNITIKEGHRLAHVLEDTLREKLPDISHVIIHIEPDDAQHA